MCRWCIRCSPPRRWRRSTMRASGRAGLNIVCGWNPEEFGCFGLEMIEDRYGQGLEWFEILSRIYTEPAPFDFKGRYYDLRGVSGKPLPVQRPRPVTLNAALLAARARLRRAGRGLPVHHLRRDRAAAVRRSTICGGGRRRRDARWAFIPPATWSAARRRTRPRRTTSTMRWRWRIRPAPTTIWATRRSSPARTIRRRIGCTASGSSAGRARIR